MGLITLLTDFGIQDEYVGVMKGVIAGIAPDARVIDITHQIPPQNIVQGAFILAAAYPYFPVGTIHVAVVDPGVGTSRRLIGLACNGHRFLAPDNGLLEKVVAGQPEPSAVALENRRFFHEPVSRTFHGRDILAPMAAHLAAGCRLTDLGPAIDRQSMVSGVIPLYRRVSERCIQGCVVAVDRFGNLMTNIDAAAVASLQRDADHGELAVEVNGTPVGSPVKAYGDVPFNCLLAIFGSRNLLEIAVNGGNARELLGVDVHAEVHVRLFLQNPKD
ncbi:MAG: hypothetical protein CR984_03425 [Proteobacteria bacterium]|nr:MAG: hypothetical protein CR984_03425 [Pseudomonadota bacterium]